MGADLILAVVEMPIGKEWSPDEWNATFKEHINSTLSTNTLEAIYEENYGESYEESDNDVTIQEYYTAIVDEYIAADYRDVTWYLINGGWVLITGGMSWGDTPSDSWDGVNALSSIEYCVKNNVKVEEDA